MHTLRCLTLLALLTAPAQAQVLRHAALGFGAQSSHEHPTFVTGEVGFAVAHSWLVAGTVRHSAWHGMDGWRAQLTLQRRVAHGTVRPYLGAGLSWTNEEHEMAWDGSEFGAMALVGLEIPVVQPSGSTLLLFAEADLYTHHYATGQVLFGARWQFGR